ncbi:L,D-transpeptidase family protein [Capnocytophaga canimorsus]|nr:L,D-transpeptidase family protein [Capnocytophaga canimorsus]WGU69538.1 L,D-transpeptidase family protein [Capnocytophaga canimorsus]
MENPKKEHTYRKIISYPICSRSGKLGPKRKQGDGQVPEGFYHIDRFNPSSNFYLSLGLNYPNLSDKRKSKVHDLGGDIFIHGACVTVGCLPMTDNYIKEIYLLATYARNNGQNKIPVYLFPFKMTDKNMQIYKGKYKYNEELISFWNNLKKRI